MLKDQGRTPFPCLDGLVVQMNGTLERKRQIVLEYAVVLSPIFRSGKLIQVGKSGHGAKCEIKQVLFDAKHGNPYVRFLTGINVTCRPDTTSNRKKKAPPPRV